MNRPFSEPGWPAQAGRNPERVWTDHVRSLYAILDGLRAAHPGVDFESCSGGGGRVDLGILGRVEQVWTSDNTDAWDRVAIQEGFTQAYPPQVMMAWVTDSPNFLTGRRLPLSFRFHVAMAGALGIGGDLLRWSDRGTGRGGGAVAAYKDDPPGRPAGPPVPDRLGAARARSGPASTSPATTEAVVLGWWGPSGYGIPLPRLRLAGLDPGVRYRDAGSGQEYWGATLMQEGLPLPGDAEFDFGSVLVRLVRAGEPGRAGEDAR